MTPLHHTVHPAGTGAPALTIALIHGWACDSTDWTPLLAPLSRLGTIILIDMPGHGRSAAPTDGYSLPTTSAKVAHILARRAPAGPVVVMGHSAGAEVALDVATAEPTSVGAVVAVDPAYGAAAGSEPLLRAVDERLARQDPRQVALQHFLRIDGSDTPRSTTMHHAARVTAPPDAIRGLHHSFAFGPGNLHFRPETDRRHRQRRVPLLALYRNGARASVGEAFCTHPQDELVARRDSGHWLHLEEPQRFVAEIGAWLRRLGINH